MARLSDEFQRAFLDEPPPAQTVSLGFVRDLAGERLFGVLLVTLALPSALPLPAPGYSIPFGVALLFLAVQLIAGRRTPWLPERWLQRSVALGTAQKVVRAGLPWMRRVEWFCRPRLTRICSTFAGRVVIGVFIALMAISMIIPVPGTNTIPAMGIFVAGFGLIEDDGLIALLGLAICVIGGAISISIFIALLWGTTSLYDYLQTLLAGA